MISYSFFDSTRAEKFAQYIGEKFTEDKSSVPLNADAVRQSLDLRLGDRFMYFRFAGKLSEFSSELSVFLPKLKIFGNLIIAVRGNESVTISTVSSVYGEILDWFSSSNITDFSLALINEFGDDDKIEIEIVAKTFFGADLTDGVVLQRLWEQILTDSDCGLGKDFCDSAKNVKPVFEYDTINVRLSPLSRMILTMSIGTVDFKSLVASYTGKAYNVMIE